MWAGRTHERLRPFILLSFSSSKKARKAQETQSYQRFQCIDHTDFNTSGTNGPCSLSWAKAGTHATPALNRAHSGLHAETGAFRTGPLSLPSERSARSQISPGWVSEWRTLPLWDLGREVLSKNAESLRDSDALMRVAVPKASRPRWAALLCLQLGDVAVLSLCAQYFLNVRGVGGITTLGALCVFSKRWTTACQNGYPLLVRLHPSVIRAICNLHNVANITL